jgi:hypothetical protein
MSTHPIAEKLVRRMKREMNGKVVNLKSVIAGRATAEELQRTVVTKEDLGDFHPAHAAYVYTQNQVSVMCEQLTALDEMASFADMISKAEEFYMPSGPPMSPLTTSYFTCWAFFDACLEPNNETIGTTVSEVGAAFGMHPELLRLIGLMQASRMGLYILQGTDGKLVMLEDITTGDRCRAISPTGYRGKKGELWYARVLPPAIPGTSEHVVFTTPYVVLRPGVPEWLAYFSRTFAHDPRARVEDYEGHMKYGPTRAYWNDYVLDAYVNHRTEVIYLAGVPDVPESLPHSRLNEEPFGR